MLENQTPGQTPLAQVIEQRGPYGVTGRQVISDRFGMRVVVDSVIRPDGTPGEQRWVDFTRPSVLVFAVDPQRYLYMIGIYQYAADRTTNEVPGGSVEVTQTAEQAVRSEALEEAGLRLRYTKELHSQYPLKTLTSRVEHTARLFFAVVESVGEATDTEELTELKKVPYDEAYQMAAVTGEIDNPAIAIGIVRIKPLVDSLEELK